MKKRKYYSIKCLGCRNEGGYMLRKIEPGQMIQTFDILHRDPKCIDCGVHWDLIDILQDSPRVYVGLPYEYTKDIDPEINTYDELNRDKIYSV